MSNGTQPAPTDKPPRKRSGCFGIGALIALGFLTLSCLICGGLGAFFESQGLAELKRADGLWIDGQTEEAAAIYTREFEWVEDDRLPQVYERIITHHYDSGDKVRAAEYCTTAIEDEIDVRFAREDLRDFFADAHRVIEDREAVELAEKQAEEQRLAEQKEALPAHKFNPSSRPGNTKSQLRAVIPLGEMTELELRQLAVRLCDKYVHRASGSFLIQFFDSDVALDNWDGTGLLRDSDWPVHLCNITVETDTKGRLYANTFGIALDEGTGKPRTDVLKK